MSRIRNKLNLAKEELTRSVIAVNPELNKELATKDNDALLFGVKDTSQIPSFLIERLKNDQKMIWHTIDKAADQGRAIDTDLHNPITYRLMSGSTSGGPINILKGINDFAIGTDGGGSVLAPAISCQLPSIIGAGLGIHVKDKKVSTDGRKFKGSVGVIGKALSTVLGVMENLTEETLTTDENDSGLKIVIPKKDSVICPDNQDMHEKIQGYLSKIDCHPYHIEEVDMTGMDNRQAGIELIQDIFEHKAADLIVTCEGPVDIHGYGETIPQHFGKVGSDLTQHHGKYLLRAANMCETTAITIPTEQLATGLFVISKKGLENSRKAIRLAKKLEQSITLPDVWKRYFLSERLEEGSLSFW